MYSLLATVSFLALLSGVCTQCTGIDHPNCPSFKNGGFCTNRGQSLNIRRRFCGVACGFCATDGSPIPCVDANKNCATFALNHQFCTRPDISNERKIATCCGTCRSVIFPAAATTTTTVTTTQTTSPAPSTDAIELPTSAQTSPLDENIPSSTILPGSD